MIYKTSAMTMTAGCSKPRNCAGNATRSYREHRPSSATVAYKLRPDARAKGTVRPTASSMSTCQVYRHLPSLTDPQEMYFRVL
jgi:hypothetical protein